jgi:dTDP-4-amino-4,6-dideoxygalactose transaminase
MTAMRLVDELLFPPEQLKPKLRMSPFGDGFMEVNRRIVEGDPSDAEPHWAPLFGAAGDSFLPTASGRAAIAAALDELALAPDDEVLILTTSGSSYVSRCVTEEIERVCRWTRRMGPGVRAVFVIHEFGWPAELPDEVRAAGLPVIEDCAYALGTAGAGGLGDYVIYSFSKAFPVQFGGLLRSGQPLKRARSRLTADGRTVLMRLLRHWLPGLAADVERRRAHFARYQAFFAGLDFAPSFALAPGVAPHACVLRLEPEALALRIKHWLDRAGIESSVHFGAGGYFLPNHQNLGEAGVDYICGNFAHALMRERA